MVDLDFYMHGAKYVCLGEIGKGWVSVCEEWLGDG